MNYFSTRDKSQSFKFKEIFLRGLAPGGGLFLPSEIKKYNKSDLDNLSKLSYSELATEIIYNFCSGDISKQDLKSLIEKAYKNFKKKDVVDVKKIGNINLLELYYGPTLAFKDIAMQVIGNMYDYLKVAKEKSVNILVATSGDTGSAAISGNKSLKNVKGYGNIVLKGSFSYTRGKNTDANDNLYRIMPANIQLALEQKYNQW